MRVLTLDELIASVDIVDFISEYVELTEKNGEYWGLSPFKQENTPSFSVRRETGRFYCFASGKGGSVVKFLSLYHKVSMHEAIEMLKRYTGCDGKILTNRNKMSATTICRKYQAKRKKNETSNLDKANILSGDYMDRFEDRPEKLEVWRQEGITDEAMQFFGVKYDSFSKCIVYPVRNIKGDIVNVGGRTTDPDFKQKGIRKYTYFKPWGGRMAVVFGVFENMKEILEKKEVIIFEGMKSVLIARGYGFKNCAAILTSHLNPAQMMILAKLGVRCVFALDKEVRIRDDDNIQKLKRFVNVEYLCDIWDLIGEKDSPVDKGEQVFKRLYDNRFKLR